jgi:2-polyprenyl-3-methyl-5-hydroxy-6-metoxy-1,4-benzoquinol methylase
MKLSEPSAWTEYWEKDDFWADSPLWRKNAALLAAYLKPKAEDTVLSLGCGAGHLEALLAPSVKSITAVDTSRYFLELCREHCVQFPNVQTELLGENYTDLQSLGEFSLIVCASVIQYYTDKSEVAALLRAAKTALKPGGKLLLADLPARETIRTRTQSFLQSLRGGYWKDLASAFFRLKFLPSAYRETAAKHATLSFKKDEFETWSREIGFHIRWIEQPLSIHAGRLNLWIEFS